MTIPAMPTGLPDRSVLDASTPHAPILIDSDQDFVDQGWPGNGSLTDPYIIAGLSITTGDTAVFVCGTSVHFVLRACTVDANQRGIVLTDVSNATIECCTALGGYFGIYLVNCSSCVLSSNLVKNSIDTGILVESSSSITLDDNRGGTRVLAYHEMGSSNTFLLVNECENCILTNNTILEGRQWDEWEYAIRLIRCAECTIKSSFMSEPWNLWGVEITRSSCCIVEDCSFTDLRTGVEMDMSDNCLVTNCSFRTDSQNGGLDIWSSRDCIVEGNDFSQAWSGIILGGTQNCTIVGNQFKDVAKGISLWFNDLFTRIENNTVLRPTEVGFDIDGATHCTVRNNSISATGVSLHYADGISMENSTLCNVSENLVHHCSTGLFLLQSDANSVWHNDIVLNSYVGVRVVDDSDGNTFASNCLGWNVMMNAEDSGLANTWEDNYWSDHLDGILYQITGTADSYDASAHLLDKEYNLPPVASYDRFTSIQAAFVFSLTNPVLVWSTSDSDPSQYTLLLNGSLVTTQSWSGGIVEVEVGHLAPGVYNYTLVLEDSRGNILTGTSILTVLPPSLLFSVLTVTAIAIPPVLFVVGLLLWRWKSRNPHPPMQHLQRATALLAGLALFGPAVFVIEGWGFTLAGSVWYLSGSFWTDSVHFDILPINFDYLYALIVTAPRFLFVVFVYRYYEGFTTRKRAVLVGLIGEAPLSALALVSPLFPPPYTPFSLALVIPLSLVLGMLLLWLFPDRVLQHGVPSTANGQAERNEIGLVQ